MKTLIAIVALLITNMAFAKPQQATHKIIAVSTEKVGEELMIKVSADELCGDFPTLTSEVKALDESSLAVAVNIYDNCSGNQTGHHSQVFMLSINPSEEAAKLGLSTKSPEVYVRVQ